MAAQCSVCVHPARDRVDGALLDPATTLREITGTTGLSKSALDRHKAHVSETLSRAQEKAEDARAQTLWAQVAALVSTASRLLTRAEDAGNDRVAVSALRECRETLRFLSTLTPPGEASAEIIEIMKAFAQEIRSRPAVADAVESRLRALTETVSYTHLTLPTTPYV